MAEVKGLRSPGWDPWEKDEKCSGKERDTGERREERREGEKKKEQGR